MSRAYLVLSDGAVYPGEAIGAPGESTGELVFTTGMAGYLETLTDPSYAGQIILQTFPLIGNYGLIPEDFEGAARCNGYVVQECCDTPSNFRSMGRLEDFLKEKGIVGISGVDTRAVTRHLREYGTMNARICKTVPSDLSEIAAWSMGDVVAVAGAGKREDYFAVGEEKYRVALMNYGAKGSIVRALRERGCAVTVLPENALADEVLALHPDGLMLSNGPGDPKENPKRIREIKKLAGKLPIFGICLGHQLLALALGGDTVKLPFGHRGVNQPVYEEATGRTWITSQNHGYAVVSESMRGLGTLSFRNANDGSCEGLDYPAIDSFSVQFHPEARSGPKDTEFLFDRFLERMEGYRHAKGQKHP